MSRLFFPLAFISQDFLTLYHLCVIADKGGSLQSELSLKGLLFLQKELSTSYSRFYQALVQPRAS